MDAARRKIDGYEFLWINVNKKSVVLNLKDAHGADLARQLIAKADVVVENYHTGTMEKFGLGYEDLKRSIRASSILARAASASRGRTKTTAARRIPTTA